MKFIIITLLISYLTGLTDVSQEGEFYLDPVLHYEPPIGCVNTKGELIPEDGVPYKKNFVFRLPSGEPWPNLEYKISSQGDSFVGVTNSLGETATVCTAEEQEITVDMNWMRAEP